MPLTRARFAKRVLRVGLGLCGIQIDFEWVVRDGGIVRRREDALGDAGHDVGELLGTHDGYLCIGPHPEEAG